MSRPVDPRDFAPHEALVSANGSAFNHHTVSQPALQAVNGAQPPGILPARLKRQAPRRQGRFTQADVAKVLKAAQKAGSEIALVRIEPDGTILIVPGDPERVAVSPQANDWD